MELSREEKSALRRSLALGVVLALLGARGAVMSILAAQPRVSALRFYTLDSNLLLLAACALQAFYEAAILLGRRFFVPSWVRLFKYVAVCTTTVTFFVVVLVLVPMAGGLSALPDALFSGSSLFHHLLCPVLGFLVFVLLDHPLFPDRRVTLWALVPTLLYAAAAIALNLAGVLCGPYPFLRVREQTALQSVLWCAALLAFAWALAYLVWKLALRRSVPPEALPGAPAEAAGWTADGYLKDQNALCKHTYRAIPACNNACGPVAAFNLRRRAGQDAAFSDVLAEMDELHLLRVPGPTRMYVMRRYFDKYLPGWRETVGREAAVAAAERCRMGVFRYLEQKVPHFVAFYRADEGFRFFNVCDGAEDVTTSVAAFAAGHLCGGSVRLIWWPEEQ